MAERMDGGSKRMVWSGLYGDMAVWCHGCKIRMGVHLGRVGFHGKETMADNSGIPGMRYEVMKHKHEHEHDSSLRIDGPGSMGIYSKQQNAKTIDQKIHIQALAPTAYRTVLPLSSLPSCPCPPHSVLPRQVIQLVIRYLSRIGWASERSLLFLFLKVVSWMT